MISKFSVPKQPCLSTPSSRDVLNSLTCTERRRVHSQPRLRPAIPMPHLPTLNPFRFSETRLLKLPATDPGAPSGWRCGCWWPWAVPRGGDTGGRAPLAGQVSCPEGEILGLDSQQGASLPLPRVPLPPFLISENSILQRCGDAVLMKTTLSQLEDSWEMFVFLGLGNMQPGAHS